MLMSTLPELPGRRYEVRGLVCAEAALASIGGGNTKKMVKSLAEQAASLGGNGIVDIRTSLSGDRGHCVMTGTAVQIL